MPRIDVDLIGYLAGALTSVSFIPQVLKTWRTKSTDDLSFGMLAVFSIGVCLWLTYGLALRSAPMIFSNAFTLMESGFLVVMKLGERRR